METTQSPGLEVEHLCYGHEPEPIGVGMNSPWLSWHVVPRRDGARQTALRVVIASSPAAAAAGKGDVWDSGEVESTDGIAIEARGAVLKSRNVYYWTVSVRDDLGLWSARREAKFETALLAPEDWTAIWLANPENRGRSVSPMFRAPLAIAKPISRARAYVTGLGYYELRVNGSKVGNSVLDPAWTDTERRVLYATHDVTDVLFVGTNAVGIQLGAGHWETPSQSAGESAPQFLIQVHVEHPDGSETILASNEKSDWRTTLETPIVSNSVYDGETYDARLERPGWDTGSYRPDEDLWKHAIVAEPPAGQLVPQPLEAIEVVGEVEPVGATLVQDGIAVVDFGQNFAGWVKLRVSGQRGAVVTIRYAELINADGTVNQVNLRSAKATDRYVLSGNPEEEWEPRFTYHGFRYAQLEWPEQQIARPPLIVGRVVRSAVERAGSVRTSSAYLNSLQDAIVWTESSNLHGLPTDCPQRDERLGWLNDVTVRAEEAMLNFNLARLMPKWVSDIADAQGPITGAIADTAPYSRYGGRPADPVAVSYLLVPWLTYLEYGDDRSLREHYEGFVAWVRYLEQSSEDGIIAFSRYGDWAPPMTESAGQHTIGAGALAARTPGDLVSTGFFYFSVSLLSRIAAAIGKAADSDRYADLALRIHSAFNARYFDRDTRNYGSGNQACNSLALHLGLVADPDRQAVFDNLVKAVNDAQGHLTTGNLTTKFLIDVLSEGGRIDLAYSLLKQRTYPSWGYMLDHGATTIWERWEHVTGGELADMASHNHAMYASVGSWFYRYLAGVKNSRPGYAALRICPYFPDDLDFFECNLNTVRGPILLKWQREGTSIRGIVEVPMNCETEIELPNMALSKVGFGRHEFEFQP